MKTVHFNGLTEGEAERLACLAEEAGEVVQAVMKILRHGYPSMHPDGGPTNRISLEREVGNFIQVVEFMKKECDITDEGIAKGMKAKKDNWGLYTYHQSFQFSMKG